MLIDCQQCKARVDAEVIGSVSVYPVQELNYKVSLLRCPVCSQPLVGIQEHLGVSDHFGEEDIWADASRVWPSPAIFLPLSIPEMIRDSLKEADKCLQAGAFTASVAMSGRAIEAMCRYFSTKSPYLGGGIKELLEREIIDKRLFQWSEELRKHRNLAAHATNDKFTHNDAEDIINFATAICDYVFVLNEKFSQFMKRKSKEKEPVVVS